MALHVFVIKETELEYPQDLRARSRKFLDLTNERKNMSTKTLRKRIALVAVSALGFGLLSSVPAQAAATTVTNSSVTGNVVVKAGGAATGTFSVTFAEATGNTWDGANTTLTVTLLDNNMNQNTCTIDTNADGTPKGAVVSGESDSLFSSSASTPTLSMSSGDMTVTISDTYDDATELESVTVSGLTATCLSTAATGTIFVKVTTGTAEIIGAKVNAKANLVTYVAAPTSGSVAHHDAGTLVYAIPATVADNSSVKMLIASDSQFPITYEATNCTKVWVGGVGAGMGYTIDAVAYDTDGEVVVLTAGAGDVAVARATGSVIGQPGTTYSADLTGGCTSTTYLGSIGKVEASAQVTVDATKVVSSTASNVTTANNDGQIEISELTSGAIADGTPTTITVTLTNGQFASAPTVSSGTNLTPSYPTSTLTIYSATGAVSGTNIHGAITPASSMVPGDSVTVSVSIANSTAPVVQSASLLVDGVLTTTRTNKVITFGAATGAATTGYSIDASTTTGKSGAVITVSETGAATFGAGRYVAVCFNDAGGDAFSTSSRQIWATVSSGDLKLAGNVSTRQASTGTAAAVVDSATTYTDFNGSTTGQCAYVQVYSASTAKSTITFTAGNAANTAADTIGAYLTSGASGGSMTMGVFAGTTLASLIKYSAFVYGTRNAVAAYSVTAGGAASVSTPGNAQGYSDVNISELAKGLFAAGSITVDLTNSAGSQSDPVATWATSGANAPVVTQTNAASDITWSYVVTDTNTVTITVTAASTTAPATFKVSNIKANLLGTKSGGVAVSNSDLYITAAGTGLSSTSYSVQAASTASVSTVSNADVLKAIVSLIASINKQIAALQKALLRR